MPVYDVRCDRCGYVWEEQLKTAQQIATTCNKCGSAFTRIVWLNTPVIRGKGNWRPYHELDKPGIFDEHKKLHFGPPKGGWKDDET